ncbi:MAG: alkaline phosphatase [Halioglobus sp.]
MLKTILAHSLVLGILCCNSTLAQIPAAAADASSDREPRSVILIIGDGMDDQQVTIARNYLAGASGHLGLDKMPLRSSSQVLSMEDRVDGGPIYVADSANTATSMATGVITSRGRISTSAGSDQDLPTIMEMANSAGYKTGIVTTASVTDATPSAFAAHISYRLCENPELMEDVSYSGIHLGECKADQKANGGMGSISEQLANSKVDVILGGGSKHFEMNAESSAESVLQLARNNGFTSVTGTDEMLEADHSERLLGLFAPSTLPVRLQGENGRGAEAPEPSILNYIHDYLGDVEQPEPMQCEPNPEFGSIPTLRQMTDTALTHLSYGNDRGFFLMIESASIDKQAHERMPCGSIGELEQLEEALQSALAFAETHPRTLILVTADHGQAAQIVPDESLFSDYPIPVYTPGMIARIITPEGGRLAINYATNNFQMGEHTGVNVPLYANREGLGLIPPFIQQPQIFALSRDYLGL